MRITLNNLPKVDTVDFVGGVFPKRQISIVASEPGCGKTWAMLQFCADISNQWKVGKFFGCSFWEKQRKSLMLIGDTGKEMIVDRINKMMLNYISPPEYIMYFISDFVVEKQPFLLNTQEGCNAIQNLIHFEKPDVVFIDTLISFMLGDENSAKEVGEIFLNLRSMAEEENCAIVVNHHFRKTQNGTRRGKGSATLNDVIGSSAMARLASVMLAMTRNRDDDMRNLVDVQTVKTWYKEVPHFQFEIAEDPETRQVKLRADYIMGNVPKLMASLQQLALDTQEGQLMKSYNVAEIFKLPEPSIRKAMHNSPYWVNLDGARDGYTFYPVHSPVSKDTESSSQSAKGQPRVG